ncbi:MAG: lysylphosphatidylglycerol synthase transmembrane domain-containing protein [Vicinamibacterales bacterium]|nr:lysylphosphatidylglycerol synthase transmembrane domain-containing protein [Vicinamibacterales bacterium]
MRATIRNVLVTALAVGLLAWFMRGADLARVWDEMRIARRDLLALGAGLVVLSYLMRAHRWVYLLAPLGPVRLRTAFRTTVIGLALSVVLPARAGEFLRPYLLARQEGLSATATFATVVFERVLDLIAVLVLLALYLAAFDPGLEVVNPAVFRAVQIGGLTMGALAAAGLVVLAVLAGHPERLHGIVLQVERVLPARLAHLVAGLARTFAEGLAIIRQPSRVLVSLGLSLLMWIVIAAQTWAVVAAFDIALPPAGALLVMAFLVVGVAVPTPGGVGGYHEAFRISVTTFFAAGNDVAIGAAIVAHMVSVMPGLVLGMWFAAQDGMSFTGLRDLAGVAKAEETAT